MTGAELRELRKAAGLSQQAIADALGVRVNTVSRWEQELRTRGVPEPNARLIRIICAQVKKKTSPP